MKSRVAVTLLGLFLFAACATHPGAPVSGFQLDGRDYLYTEHEWSFSGRAAISSKKESVSLSVLWSHQFEGDEIELTGPFGQGRTLIYLSDGGVSFDFGDKKLKFRDDVDKQIETYTKVEVPVSALKFWVVGLVDPEESYVLVENGFLQSGWIVEYVKMQSIGHNVLPQKIKIEKVQETEKVPTKLKLIIDNWNIK